MKAALFVFSLFLLPGLTEQAQAYDGHPVRDVGTGCLVGGGAFASYGAYQGLKAGHPWWRDEAWEGAVIGCGVGVVVGGVTSLAAPSDAPSEEELANADAQEQSPDQE